MWGEFFNSSTFAAQLKGRHPFEFWDQLGEVILPQLKAQIGRRNPWPGSRFFTKNPAGGRTLTIHLRSGDIFSGDNPHPGYAQPPLSFYLAVVDECKPRRVKLIFEDFGNPVISALLHELKSRKIIVSVIDGPIEEALLEIYRSTNFVAARGSFSSPMLAMSPHVRRIYSWGAFPHRRLGENWKREVSVIEAHGSGYSELVTPWRNSQVQRTAMLEWRPDSIALTRVGAER